VLSGLTGISSARHLIRYMETYTEPRDFVENPHFAEQRTESLQVLDVSAVDPPVVDIVLDFARLPYCFTLQICSGHYLHAGQTDPHNQDPLPRNHEIQEVEYRIAYIALCLANNRQGRSLFAELERVASLDPEYIQFGSADWFWERQVNSYVLQVEPRRMKSLDRARIPYQEAQHLERVRHSFFSEIRMLLRKLLEGSSNRAGHR
jgi:hypothetical protein